MFTGLIDLPWWGYVVVALAITHLTIVSVTVFLHRHQAHRAIDLHPLISHGFRFWLWLTTGMVTREWAAVHRKHHARVETKDDPHSPRFFGINKVLWQGVELYRAAVQDAAMLEKYGHGTPDDWLERRLYARHSTLGIVLMLVVNVVLFGAIGISIWAVQMAWIPFFAAGVINGVGHYWGYRNFEVTDTSTNIVPWGVLIGGEELHNNHHAFATSARFSSRPWEIDLGWLYIRLLALLRLARVKRLAPVPGQRRSHTGVDLETVRAVVTGRMHVMAAYAREVVSRVHRDELKRAGAHSRTLLKPIRRWLNREALLDEATRVRLAQALSHSAPLTLVHQYKQRLQALWQERAATQEALVAALTEWCRQAEETGIAALADFATSLRRYTLQPARFA